MASTMAGLSNQMSALPTSTSATLTMQGTRSTASHGSSCSTSLPWLRQCMSLPAGKSMTIGEPDLTAYLHPAMEEMGPEEEEVAMADPGLLTGTETNIGRSHGIGA